MWHNKFTLTVLRSLRLTIISLRLYLYHCGISHTDISTSALQTFLSVLLANTRVFVWKYLFLDTERKKRYCEI